MDRNERELCITAVCIFLFMLLMESALVNVFWTQNLKN